MLITQHWNIGYTCYTDCSRHIGGHITSSDSLPHNCILSFHVVGYQLSNKLVHELAGFPTANYSGLLAVDGNRAGFVETDPDMSI